MQQPPDPLSPPLPCLAKLLWKWGLGGQGSGFLAIVCEADAALSPALSLMGVLHSCVSPSVSPFYLCAQVPGLALRPCGCIREHLGISSSVSCSC